METTLAKPLSGTEIINAIIYDIRKSLELDDRFASHAAYGSFSFSGSLSVRLPNSHIESFTRTVHGERGPAMVEDDSEVATVPVERVEQAPNEVRVDTDQPVPVLVSENGKTEEKWKKVGKTPFKKKNTVVGA